MRKLSTFKITGIVLLKISLVFALVLPGQGAEAKEVTLNDAKMIGVNFLKLKSNNPSVCDSLSLVEGFNHGSEGLYVFAIHPAPGFVIVAGDDRVEPVLGYSFNSEISADNMSPDVKQWFQSNSEQIEIIIAQDLPATPESESSWSSLRSATTERTMKSGVNVSPLLSTTWNQSPYYNESCPYDEGSQTYTITGCVATAMAQIMKYWNHPTQGEGSHTYTHATYGDQSADFGNTTYNWGSMPNYLSSSNEAVATLMYHCGVSVNMNYSPGGSGAYNSMVMSALPNYFKYASDIDYVSRSSYTNDQWNDLLLGQLTAGRPVYYTGRRATGGHAFVCDGYDGSMYHFNWGWGGYADGYFSIDNLNPATRTYNDDQQVIYNIHPDGTTEQPILSLNPMTQNIDANTGTVTFSVSNTGTGTMNWYASITGGTSWVNITSGTGGTNTGSINVEVAANEGDSRTATIEVTSSGATGSPKQVTIVQEAAAGKPDLFVNITKVNTPSLEAGDIFRADIQKGNQGEEASVPGLVKYILSKDAAVSQDDIVLEENRPNNSWSAGYNESYEFNDLRIPESIEAGEWYFIISLDSDEEIEEENENNNIASGQFTVTEPGNPDVYVSSLTAAPDVLEPMSYLEGHFTIGNAGETEMPASHYRYAISKDASYSADDYTVAYDELAAMNPGYENTNGSTGDFQLPESIECGEWYLIVMLDCDAAVVEENESNNMAAVKFSVVRPDIYVSIGTVHTPNPAPGDLFSVEVEEGNQGGMDSKPGLVKYILSRDNAISAEDVILAEGSPNATWDAGYKREYTLDDLRIPESAEEGIWYFIISLDTDSEIEETNEENNISFAQLNIEKNEMPDIYVANLSISPTIVEPLSSLEGHFEIGNNGEADMPVSYYRYAISKDASYSGDDYTVSYGELGAISAGSNSQSESTGNFQLPQSVGYGDWYLIVMADCDSEVDEENENNNMAYYRFTVANPDLYISFGTNYTPSLAAGDFIRIDIEKGNQGGKASLPGLVKYYLSKDNSPSTDDILLEEGRPGNTWEAGFSQSYTFDDIRVPESVEAGEWFFIATLDSDSEITEVNEDNNLAVAQLTVTRADMPDIYVSGLSLDPDVVEPLAYLEGHFEIGNVGGAEMPSSHYRYAISNDVYYSGDDYTITYGELGRMDAGYSSNSSTGDFQLPESIGAGSWYLIVMLDSDKAIEEENENNNYVVSGFTVVQSDLFVDFHTVYTPSLLPGDVFRADVEFGNQGGIETAPGMIKYYLSRDEIISSEDIVLMESNQQAVWASGYNSQFELNDFRIPDGTEDGQWYIIASVDSNDEINEENEDNNTASASLIVSPTEPILVVNEETFEIDFTEGVLSFQISNSGTGTLTWDVSVIEGGEWVEIQNNEKSGSGEATIFITYSENTECDLRSGKILIESNAYNGNTKELLIDQESDPDNVPDLAVAEVDAEYGGRELRVEVAINNNGGCNSEETKVEYFLCTETDCENPVSWLGTSNCDPLANGQSISIQTNIQLEGIEDGTYYLAAKVDPNGIVIETDKENNVLYYQINISSTGIDKKLLEKALTVYPNPTSDWVNISMEGADVQSGMLTIYDQMGRVVDQFEIEEFFPWEKRIDTRNWEAGIYSLVVNSSDEFVHRKLMVR